MEVKEKTVSQSFTEQIQIVMPGDINGAGRLFGGRLVEWIDVVAGVVARRHSGCDITTAFMDSLQFLNPANVNDTIVLIGRVTYVGRTSMEVRVDTYVEKLSGKKELANRAYLSMVAIDHEGKPTPVPRLILCNDEERAEWAAGEKRANYRKSCRIRPQCQV